MKCEIVATKEIKHFANNDSTAHTLIKAGVLRLIENESGDLVRMGNGQVIPKMEPPAQPRWYVGIRKQYNSGKSIPAIVFEVGNTTRETYTGAPKEAAQGFCQRVVPADILKQYKQAYKDFYGN